MGGEPEFGHQRNDEFLPDTGRISTAISFETAAPIRAASLEPEWMQPTTLPLPLGEAENRFKETVIQRLTEIPTKSMMPMPIGDDQHAHHHPKRGQRLWGSSDRVSTMATDRASQSIARE